jgi:phenylalanine-4-hydroxylase
MELRHTKKVWKPIGKLEGINLAIGHESKDLNAYDILESKTVKLEFEGGIIVEGEIVTGSETQGEITLAKLYCTDSRQNRFISTRMGRL